MKQHLVPIFFSLVIAGLFFTAVYFGFYGLSLTAFVLFLISLYFLSTEFKDSQDLIALERLALETLPKTEVSRFNPLDNINTVSGIEAQDSQEPFVQDSRTESSTELQHSLDEISDDLIPFPNEHNNNTVESSGQKNYQSIDQKYLLSEDDQREVNSSDLESTYPHIQGINAEMKLQQFEFTGSSGEEEPSAAVVSTQWPTDRSTSEAQNSQLPAKIFPVKDEEIKGSVLSLIDEFYDKTSRRKHQKDLVVVDSKRPTLLEKSLCHYLNGELPFTEIVCNNLLPGLDVVPAVGANRLHPDIESFLLRMKNRYDRVFILVGQSSEELWRNHLKPTQTASEPAAGSSETQPQDQLEI